MKINKPEAVLVADSSLEMQHRLHSSLGDCGWKAVCCSSVEEGVASLSEHSVSLAFVSTCFGDGAENSNGNSNGQAKGFGAAVEFMESSPGLAIVFTSHDGTYEEAVEALRLGAYDFLRKPLADEDVALLLRRFAQRQELKKRVFRAQKRYIHLLQNIPLVIFSLNRDLRLDFVNQACLGVFGYHPYEAMRSDGWFLKRFHPDDRNRVRHFFLKSMNGPPVSEQFRMFNRAGETVHCMVKTMPGFLAAGNGSEENAQRDSIEGVIVDITRRVHLEKALLQDEKLKTLGAISAEVAHEVRNPLFSIAGFARRIKSNIPDMKEADIILREAGRLERLLDRIGLYLKPASVQREICNINQLLSNSMDILFPEIKDRNVWAELDLDPSVPGVFVDAEVLGQVFMNLFSFGMAELASGGRMQVKSCLNAGNIVIYIRSSAGEGEAAAGSDPVYDLLPFDEARAGRGLPLCHRLLKEMGGVLTVDREEQDLVFSVTLPQLIHRTAGKDEQAKTPSASHGCLQDGGRGDTKLLHSEREFERKVASEWKRTVRTGDPISLLLLEIDQFNHFLALYGDEEAGRVLGLIRKALAQVLKRPGDTASSWGEPGFATLLPQTNEVGALIVAEDIRRSVQAMMIPHEQVGTEFLTLSIGVASLIPQDGAQPADLIAEATQALHWARERGPGTIFATGME